MRAADSVGPLILSKFQQEKQERPVRYLRCELPCSRGVTASGSPSIKMDYANPSQFHNTRGEKFFAPTPCLCHSERRCLAVLGPPAHLSSEPQHMCPCAHRSGRHVRPSTSLLARTAHLPMYAGAHLRMCRSRRQACALRMSLRCWRQEQSSGGRMPGRRRRYLTHHAT
jgi:hypothetical protein